MALYIQHFKAYLFCRSVSKWEHKKTASGTSFFCSWAMHTHSSLGKYLGISSFERLERSSGHILSSSWHISSSTGFTSIERAASFLDTGVMF